MGRVVVVVLASLLAWTSTAMAQDRPRVGVLKLTSSAPIFVGVEKGFFKEFGVEPELVYFQAAAPISMAVAAGQIDVGATGLTAATYNIVLGGETMWIVADKGREWPDHRLTAIVVQKDLYDAGLRLGAGTALLLLVAAEMIAVESGIGFLVLHAGNLMQTTKLMVGIVVLSLLGVLSHWGLGWLERLAIPWRASS